MGREKTDHNSIEFRRHNSEGETPGPIPNPEAKPFSADGTALVTGWESRTPPDIFTKGLPGSGGLSSFSDHDVAEEEPLVPPPPRRPAGSRSAGSHSAGSRSPRQQGSPRPPRPPRDDDDTRRPRLPEPAPPPDGEPGGLDRDARAELRSLPASLADKVASHLIVAGRLLDDDPSA